MRALRAASTLEIIASYPGDDDFDAYRSDPIAVLVDGDTVALPSDPPPPPPPTTTTPSTPTSTPPSVPPGPPSEPPDAPATTTPAPGGDEQPEATEIVDDPDDLVAVAVAAATSSDPDDGADGADETAQAIDPDGSAPASGATTSIGGAADPDQGPRSSSAELGRSSLAASTADPTRISTDPRFVMENLLLTLFLLIFSVYPAYLINNTLAENYDEVLGWFGPVTRRTGRLRARRGAIPGPVVLGLSGLAAAVLYSFLDPGLGWNLTSLALFLGLFVSTVTITGVYDVARKRYLHHHYGIVSSLRGYPAGLLIGVVLVVFSRAADLTPGYLFGVFTALGFATQIDRRHDGRGIAAASVWLLAVTLACWFLWIPVADAASAPDAGFGTIFLDTTLASVWVVGIQALVFGLMPLRFLDGEKLRFWSTRAWVAIYGVGMFAFVHSMVRPGTEVDGDTFRSAVVLFALFTAVALAFWGYFRLRTDAPGDLEPPTDPPRADDLVDA
jgi:hypothetical protein